MVAIFVPTRPVGVASVPVATGRPSTGEPVAEVLVQRRDTVVVEAGGDRAEDREVGRIGAESIEVPGHLPAHVAQRVLGAATLELVDRDDLGEVEHVDLLQLAGRAELRGHHVDRHIDVIDDPGVPLPDARRLDDHEVEARRLAGGHDVVEGLGNLARAAGGERTEEHLRRLDRVHADPVAEQRPAAPATRRVDGEHRDPELVLLVEAESADELVGQRRLAGAAGPGDADDGRRAAFARRRRSRRGACGSTRPSSSAVIRLASAPSSPASTGSTDSMGATTGSLSRRRHDRVDHAGESEALAVSGREDSRDAVVMQRRDLAVDDDPTSASEDPHVPQAAGPQLDRRGSGSTRCGRPDTRTPPRLARPRARPRSPPRARIGCGRGGPPRSPGTAGCAA